MFPCLIAVTLLLCLSLNNTVEGFSIDRWLNLLTGGLYRSGTIPSVSQNLDLTNVISTNRRSYKPSRVGRNLIPILIFLLNVQDVSASPLNPQLIQLRGPFFQGWLVRTIDHENDCSFITIIGSFSRKSSSIYDEHYVFCGIQHKDQCWQLDAFPSIDSVSITGSDASKSSLFQTLKATNITWCATGLGYFSINEDECIIDFKIGSCHMKSTSSMRRPWKFLPKLADGPEGWLGYTPLLPCHYYIHSTGSACKYTLHLPNGNTVISSGRAFSHIEGNHGTNFPEGWTWAQAISPNNDASFSLVAGLFEIGPIKPFNIVLYLRHGDSISIFRTTDADFIDHMMDSKRGCVSIRARSLRGDAILELDITSQQTRSFESNFGETIYIPTANGFSNQPGCKETYTAKATARIRKFDSILKSHRTDSIEFDLVALEFGAGFQKGVFSSKNFIK